MVRSMLSALLRRVQGPGARVSDAPGPRFTPDVQALEVREVPAVLMLFTADAPALRAPESATEEVTVSRDATPKGGITLSDILVSSYESKSSS